MDLALARTAASLEQLAVDTYQTGIDSGLVTTMAIADAAVLFQSHHQAHLDALNGANVNVGANTVNLGPQSAVIRSVVRSGSRPARRRPPARPGPDGAAAVGAPLYRDRRVARFAGVRGALGADVAGSREVRGFHRLRLR